MCFRNIKKIQAIQYKISIYYEMGIHRMTKYTAEGAIIVKLTIKVKFMLRSVKNKKLNILHVKLRKKKKTTRKTERMRYKRCRGQVNIMCRQNFNQNLCN